MKIIITDIYITYYPGVPATPLDDNAVVPKTCSTNDMDHAVTVDHTGYGEEI